MRLPNGASAHWNLYGLAKQNEASLKGKRAYGAVNRVAVPRCPHTPSHFVYVLSQVHVSGKASNKHSAFVQV